MGLWIRMVPDIRRSRRGRVGSSPPPLPLENPKFLIYTKNRPRNPSPIPGKHRNHSDLHPWKQLWIRTCQKTEFIHKYIIYWVMKKNGWNRIQLRASLSKSLCCILYCEHQLHLLNSNNVSSTNGYQRLDVPVALKSIHYHRKIGDGVVVLRSWVIPLWDWRLSSKFTKLGKSKHQMYKRCSSCSL